MLSSIGGGGGGGGGGHVCQINFNSELYLPLDYFYVPNPHALPYTYTFASRNFGWL